LSLLSPCDVLHLGEAYLLSLGVLHPLAVLCIRCRGPEAGLLSRGSHRARRSLQVVLGLCGVWRHFRVGGADSSSCSRLWGSWSRKGWWRCAYSGVINWRGSTSWHDSRLGVVLARHDVKTAYVGFMCGTLVANAARRTSPAYMSLLRDWQRDVPLVQWLRLREAWRWGFSRGGRCRSRRGETQGKTWRTSSGRLDSTGQGAQ